jgi:RNA polymerase sigma-70 factor (ECF subfamily)
MKNQKMDSQETKFAQLVEEQKSTIYTVCYMFSKDQDEVSDLFQEVLINLWKSFSTFEGRSDIRTWVYRVAMNVCVSLDRKKKHRDTVPLTMDINPYEDENPNSKQMEMLRKRISLLGPFDRAIIMLWLENMSYDEIAAVVGISVKNVSVRLYRIKEELKKMK